MTFALLLAAAAFLVCAVSVRILKPVAPALGWIDAPSGSALKVHARPVPLVGGAAMFVAGAAAAALALGRRHPDPIVAAAWVAAAIVSILGLVDDRRPLSPLVRLVVEGAVASWLAWQALADAGFEGAGGVAAAAAAALYLIVALNTFNMQDGLDGLAGSLALVSLVGCAFVAAARHDLALLWTAAALAGAVAGFLLYNWPPASIFMGDGGSYLLGFGIGALTLLLALRGFSTRDLLVAPLLVGLPLVDGAVSLVRRLARGSSPFEGDRAHLYDRLAQRGMPVWGVDLICTAAHAACVATGALLLR